MTVVEQKAVVKTQILPLFVEMAARKNGVTIPQLRAEMKKRGIPSMKVVEMEADAVLKRFTGRCKKVLGATVTVTGKTAKCANGSAKRPAPNASAKKTPAKKKAAAKPKAKPEPAPPPSKPPKEGAKIQQAMLVRALNEVSGAIERRSSMPIIQNVLVNAGDGVLHFVGTDLYNTLDVRAPAQIGKMDSLCFSARVALAAARKMPKHELLLESTGKNQGVKLSTSRVAFTLPGMHAQDYPAIPVLAGEPSAVTNGEELYAALKVVSCAISQDNTRPHLNGIQIAFESDALRLVATDGHRLACATVPRTEKLPKTVSAKDVFPILVNADCAHILQTIVKRRLVAKLKVGGTMRLLVGPENARFDVGTTSLTAKLTQEEFPPWQKVVPKKNKAAVEVSSGALFQALGRASVTASDKSGAIRFEIGKDELVLTSENPDVGEFRETLHAKIKSNDGATEVGYNAKYIMEALQGFDADNVVLKLGAALDPLLLHAVGKPSAFHVIMPMRI